MRDESVALPQVASYPERLAARRRAALDDRRKCVRELIATMRMRADSVWSSARLDPVWVEWPNSGHYDDGSSFRTRIKFWRWRIGELDTLIDRIDAAALVRDPARERIGFGR